MEEQHSTDGNTETTHVEAAPVKGVVAYALPPNKVASFMRPSLVDHALHHGILLIPIDLTKPLAVQYHDRPFHCILHKMYDPDWVRQLVDFQSTNPCVIVVDHPCFIQRLQDRVSMLEVVDHLAPPPDGARFRIGIPKQRVVYKDKDVAGDLELEFPVIAKPLMSNGSPDSHLLSLVLTPDGFNQLNLQKTPLDSGLSQLNPRKTPLDGVLNQLNPQKTPLDSGLNQLNAHTPLVLQEFVNHGGVLFKVYVAGNHVQCVRRPSLPDLNLSQSEFQGAAYVPFSQISNLPSSTQQLQEAELPPLDLVDHVARSLRHALNLHLFNFDMIRDTRANQTTPSFLVIDINYFPGYAKVPGFESMLTDFFLDLLQSSKLSQD